MRNALTVQSFTLVTQVLKDMGTVFSPSVITACTLPNGKKLQIITPLKTQRVDGDKAQRECMGVLQCFEHLSNSLLWFCGHLGFLAWPPDQVSSPQPFSTSVIRILPYCYGFLQYRKFCASCLSCT